MSTALRYYRTALMPLAFAMVFAACTPSPDLQKVEELTPYFDLADWVDQQVAQLAEQSYTLTKEVRYKNTSDQITQKSDELGADFWQKELQQIKAADINRPALLRSYSVDSTSGGGIKEVTYAAKDPSLKTRRVTVAYKSSLITQVTVEMMIENVLFTMKRNMHLDLEDGVISAYWIKGQQQMVIGGLETYLVDAKLIR